MSKISDYGTPIDGVVAAQVLDSQGEILDVKGADISELEAGKGVWNSDHRNAFPDVVGRIVHARKIFGPEDCEDDRQKYFWNQFKSPIIYAKGYLFDKDGEHRAAQAVSAILRNQSRTDSPLKMKASVEGGIIERGKTNSNILKRTKITKVALTLTPANHSTLIETSALTKSSRPGDAALISEYVHFAKDSVPTFVENPADRIAYKVEKIASLTKALTAGFGGASSPSSRVGGSVLQTETIDSGNKFKHINCPSCGKEQPYLKYQVKCRDCHKNFPFDTLAKFFLSKAETSVASLKKADESEDEHAKFARMMGSDGKLKELWKLKTVHGSDPEKRKRIDAHIHKRINELMTNPESHIDTSAKEPEGSSKPESSERVVPGRHLIGTEDQKTSQKRNPGKPLVSPKHADAIRAEREQIADYTGEAPERDPATHSFTTSKLVATPTLSRKDGTTVYGPSYSEHVILHEDRPIGHAQVHHTKGEEPYIKMDFDKDTMDKIPGANRVKLNSEAALKQYLKSQYFKQHLKNYKEDVDARTAQSQEEKAKALAGRGVEDVKADAARRQEAQRDSTKNAAPKGEIPTFERDRAVSEPQPPVDPKEVARTMATKDKAAPVRVSSMETPAVDTPANTKWRRVPKDK
jgi:hypothetical protein